MTAYAEFHGQILREVTGINIDGKTYAASAIERDHNDLRALCGAVLEHFGISGLDAVLKTALGVRHQPAEPAPCPTCGADCAGANPPVTYCPMQNIEELKRAVAPLVAIANAYDANDLDDEARKHWGPGPDHNAFTNDTPPQQIELYSGRGGKRLLTLADCITARSAAR
jgi:hypothetical protein